MLAYSSQRYDGKNRQLELRELFISVILLEITTVAKGYEEDDGISSTVESDLSSDEEQALQGAHYNLVAEVVPIHNFGDPDYANFVDLVLAVTASIRETDM